MKIAFVLVLCQIALSAAQVNWDDGLGGDDDDYEDTSFGDADDFAQVMDDLYAEEALDDGSYNIQGRGYVQSKVGGRQFVDQYLRPEQTRQVLSASKGGLSSYACPSSVQRPYRSQEFATLNSRPVQLPTRPSARVGYGTNLIGSRKMSTAARVGGRY